MILNKSFTKCNILRPINDNDKPPIIVINITDSKISNPGIENGK